MNAAESEDLVAKVERREAPRPTSLGARGHLAARGGYVNPASRGATSLHPGASRRSTPSRGSRGKWQTSDAWRRENAKAGCLKRRSESKSEAPLNLTPLFCGERSTRIL